MAMLGAKCSPCCATAEPTCECPDDKELPSTVTIKLSGPMGTREKVSDLLPIRFDSCIGGTGAVAFATTGKGGDAGDPASRGPVTGVTLSNGGSGYAKIGRIAPVLSIGNEAIIQAQAEFTLASSKDDCGLDYWSVKAIKITDGGVGYQDGEQLKITVAKNSTAEVAATGTIQVARAEPELKATAPVGTGATFEVVVAEIEYADPSLWAVSSVSVTGDTEGYQDGDVLTFAGDVEEVSPATARIVCNRIAPNVSGNFFSLFGTGGSGAAFSYTYTQGGTEPEIYWAIDSVTIEGGGSGYDATGILFADTVIEGESLSAAAILIDAVDENGAIQSVILLDGGSFFAHDGTIAAVVVDNGGEYYKSTLGGVTITNGGKYYQESTTVPALAPTVTVSIDQLWPSRGSGAVLSANIETTYGSPNFGKIAGVTVEDGGQNYLEWTWDYACDCEWGGKDGYQHEVVAWRALANWPTGFDFESGSLESNLTCTYVAFRCYDDGPGPPMGHLLRAKLVSDIKTEWVPVGAQSGKPGRDEAPITELPSRSGDAENGLGGYGDELEGWAYVDEETDEVVAPPITVTVEQMLPSAGSGAEITATIDDDPESETFGHVTLAIANGGSGYLGKALGRAFANNRGRPVTVDYRGPSLPPTVTDYFSLCPESSIFAGCGTTLTSDTLIDDCSDFTFRATFGEATAEVSPGGSITPAFEGPNKCCVRCYNKCPDGFELSQVAVTFLLESTTGFLLKQADNPGMLNRDAFLMECPGDEQEIVFDFEDLESQNHCDVLRVCVVGQQEGFPWVGFQCGTHDGITEPPEITVPMTEPGVLLRGDLGVVLDPPADLYLYSGRPPGSIACCTVPEGPECVAARVAIDIYRLRCDEQAISVVKRSSWSNRSVVAIGGLFTLFPLHEFLEETTYTNANASRACEDLEEWPSVTTKSEGYIEVDEKRNIDLTYSGFGFTLGGLVARRICPSYDIDVEFS